MITDKTFLHHCMDCGASACTPHHRDCASHERDWPEARADAIGQNGGDGLHYAKAPCGSDITACLLNPCGQCPGYEYAEDSDGESALSQALSMPSKYHVRLKGGWCDVYDVLKAFGVTNPADQHAIKKMLMPGKRGHKGGIQDRREAIQSLHRAIELEDDA